MFGLSFNLRTPAAAPTRATAVAGDRQPIIQMHQVVKIYKTVAGEFTVLKGIDAAFYPGEFVGVIGKSGSGKSTLINMITGIDRPTSGEVIVGGVEVHRLSEGQLSTWRGRNLGIVFQFFQLLPMLSLLENVMLPMDFCNLYPPRQRRERAMDLLRLVEMEDHAHKLPSTISGGQQQRVAIARALANDPPILIADEPTGNLDSRTAESVFEMFTGLARQGKTIVIVTHDNSLAQRVARTVLISDGEIVNNWIYRSLPTLSHLQMLKASKSLNRQVFSRGQHIIHQGQANDRFYIISQGAVEIVVQRPGRDEAVVSQMGPGQYFGEIEMLRAQSAVATVRAASEPVEVLSIERQVLGELLDESQSTREAIEYTVRQRLDENCAAHR